MLFKQVCFAGLADGSITLAFRRWRRPTVRAGGTLQTPACRLAIDDIRVVSDAEISDDDALRAGYPSRSALLADIAARTEGDLYRIAFHSLGADPRAVLREKADLPEAEWDAILQRLARLDRASAHGPWTERVLRLIHAEPPGTRAADLAMQLGRPTDQFKVDVRKLKALGLTESLGTGYRVSPRGLALLARLDGPG